MRPDRDPWTVLVPVKRLAQAKTRLAVADDARAALALAMAADTVQAALAAEMVAEVVVITSDPSAATALAALGARVIDDRPDAGLNPALTYGASVARNRSVAALSADLPALRPEHLDDALLRAAAHLRCVVADVEGAGTTLLTAQSVADFTPAFGTGSRARHLASGAVDLSAEVARALRTDVDTMAALDAAVALGVGARTAAALNTLSHVQATVRRFDPDTHDGDVLLDDGTVVRFDADAFDQSGLRLMRPGQRVRLRLDHDGRVSFLTIATMPDPPGHANGPPGDN